MKARRKCVLVLVAACFLTSALWAKEIPFAEPEAVGMSSAKLEAMQAVAETMVEENKIAGIITMAARHGRIVHFEAYGHRDIDERWLMERDTIVRIYSMSKPITSVAAMILYDRGLLQLDEPVETYIPALRGLKVYGEPEYATPKRKVTVRDLLRHTSGLTYGIFGDTPVDKMYRQRNVLSDIPLKEMMQRLAEIPLLYQPGTRWHYSVSTDVLGRVVECVSGQTLDVFFAENIFKPLDMRDTAFYVGEDKYDRFSRCYGPDPNGGLRLAQEIEGYDFLRPPKFLSGGGGLTSTARDYMRFCQMLLNKGQLDGVRILEAETVEEMTRDQLPNGVSAGEGAGFGLGFSVQLQPDPSGQVRVGEYGWAGAASTFFGISPQDDTVVLILTQYMPFNNQIPKTLKPLVYAALNEN